VREVVVHMHTDMVVADNLVVVLLPVVAVADNSVVLLVVVVADSSAVARPVAVVDSPAVVPLPVVAL